MAASDDVLTPRQLARRTTTSSACFRTLVELEDFGVRKALARNRSTPDDVLLLVLADPHPRVGYLVCSRATLSEVVAIALASHPDIEVRCHLAVRRELPEAVQRLLAHDKIVHVKYALLKREQLSEHVSNTLANASEPLVRIALAKRPDCSVAALTQLADDSDPGVCREVARSTRVPSAVLSKLMQHSDTWVRVAVAQNTTSPASARDRLGRDVDESVRYCAAYAAHQVQDSGSLSQHVKNRDDGFRWIVAVSGNSESVAPLLHDKSPRVRWSAVTRGFATLADLLALARDSDPMVRLSLAGLPTALPDAVSVVLLADPDSGVRASLAGRADLGPATLLSLTQDEDMYVRRVARLGDPEGDESRLKSNETPSSARARSNRITEADMLQIARSGEAASMRHLARNRVCTDAVRVVLAASDDVEVRTILAASRTSKPALLTELLRLHDDLVDRTVAGNILVPLPEHPRSWSSCSFTVRQSLAARKDLSDELRVQLASDVSSLVRLAVASNPTSGPEILALLAADVDHLVRAAVARHRCTSTSTLRGLVDDPTYEARGTLSRRLDRLDADALSRLATNDQCRLGLARSKISSTHLLSLLLADDSHVVVTETAKNLRTPARALTPLLSHPSSAVRWHAAKRVTWLSEEQALLLASDASWTVREGLAQNPIAPSCALDVLAREDTLSIRLAVARHPNASDEALDSLARVWNHQIHSAVADHPRANAPALDHLARDRNASTRAAVARNANTPTSTLGRLARDKRDWVRAAVAENPNTDPRTLRRLAGDKSQWTRATVGRNRRTGIAVLEVLASDAAADVRAAVAGNGRTPLKLLIHLAADADSIVHRSLAKNPNLPAEERVLSALY